MFQYIFPLNGPESFTTAGLEFVIVFTCLELFINLLWKFLRAPVKHREFRSLAWAILFLGFGATWIFFITADYFTVDMSFREELSLWGYLSLVSSATVLIVITEILEQKKYKYYSYAMLILLGITIFASIIEMQEISRFLMILGTPIALGYMVHYVNILNKLGNRANELRYQIYGFFTGISLIFMGFTLIGDFFLNNYGLIYRIWGDSIMIIGMMIFWYSSEALPDTSEFDWEDKIRGILLISSNSGMALFSRFFRLGNSDNTQDVLIAGALSSVDVILQTMTGKKKLKMVKLADKVLHFEYRKNFIGVIIADEGMRTIQIRLRQFADEFDQRYSDKLPRWNGESSAFHQMESLADEIFIPFRG